MSLPYIHSPSFLSALTDVGISPPAQREPLPTRRRKAGSRGSRDTTNAPHRSFMKEVCRLRTPYPLLKSAAQCDRVVSSPATVFPYDSDYLAESGGEPAGRW